MLLQRRLLHAEHGQRAGGVVLGPWWTAAKRWVLPGSIYRLRGFCWVKNPGVGNGVGSGDTPAHAHAVEDIVLFCLTSLSRSEDTSALKGSSLSKTYKQFFQQYLISPNTATGDHIGFLTLSSALLATCRALPRFTETASCPYTALPCQRCGNRVFAEEASVTMRPQSPAEHELPVLTPPGTQRGAVGPYRYVGRTRAVPGVRRGGVLCNEVKF